MRRHPEGRVESARTADEAAEAGRDAEGPTRANPGHARS